MSETFRSTVQLNGKTATGIPVPPEVIEALGSGNKPAVTVTIGGYSYRSTVGVRGGVFLIPLSAEHRKGAGVAAGDEVEVALELDTAPREVEVPADLAEALKADKQAAAFFETLSYSAKQRYVLPIGEAKTDETRQRRIAKAVADLHAGKK